MPIKNNFNAFADTGSKPAKKRLMDNQDTAHKGDSGSDDRKMITFYVSAKKHAALKAYCKQEARVSKTAYGLPLASIVLTVSAVLTRSALPVPVGTITKSR